MTLREFYPHQLQAYHYAQAERHPALFMEMRLGKTLVAVRTCLRWYTPLDPELGLRVLVVAPGSALGSWESELKQEGASAVWLTGTKKKRRESLAFTFDRKASRREFLFALINKEGWIALPEIAAKRWDVVICDESTFLKNPTAKVTKFFAKYFRDVPHRWILTGTPCPEGEHEYFCQLQFLRGGAFGFTRYWDFRAHYMEPHPCGYGWILKPGAPDHLRRVVGKTCHILRRKDAGLERKKIYERRELELPKEIRKIYDRAEESMILEAPGIGVISSTKWITTSWGWLRQLCGGFAQDRLVWDGKIKELLALLQGELAREKVVVWCCYNREITSIIDALRINRISCNWWNGLIRPEMREATRKIFQTKKDPRVLVLQQATAQTGMDLSIADTAIYYSSPPGQLARSQTEDRILSIKKTSPLLYLDLTVKDSVDVDVLEVLKEKIALSDLSLSRALAAKMRERRSR